MADLPPWVLILQIVAVIGFLEWSRRRKSAQESTHTVHQQPAATTLDIKAEPDQPIGFGRKNLWVAVRGNDPRQLAQSLQLHGVQPCNWHSGFLAAYAYPSDYVFVTPPVDGFLMAVGTALPDPGDAAALPSWRSLMSRLSATFGSAHFFATHRGSGYSAWARYSEGVEDRLFAHGDEGIHDLGAPLPEEAAILARLPDPTAAETDPEYWERDDVRSPEEEDVLRLAAAWTVDPSSLESRDLPPSVGLVGRLDQAHSVRPW